MKTPLRSILVAVVATLGLSAGLAPAQTLSANAERVLQYLEDQKGVKTLAGQEERPAQLTADQQLILGITGKRPAIRGWDIRGDNPSPVTEARNSWMNYNQLVQFSWHMGYPPNADSFDNAKLPSDPAIVSAAIDQMLTPGTSLNTSFLAKLDVVAAQLQTLDNEDVPVLWRPFHEGESYSGNPNRSSFWWGKAGPAQYKRLWQFMFDYYRTTKGLTNLIWVYSTLDNPASSWTGSVSDWYPGDAYVHAVGTDVYDGTWSPYYNTLNALTPGSPVALSECDIIPDPAVMQANNTLWGWFLAWHSTYVQLNSNAHLSYVYNHSLVITADEMPDLKNALLPAGNPTFSVPGGTYASAQTVTISTATAGASIRYTTNGTTPTSTTGTLYASPVTISSTATLKAIAYKAGLLDSGVTSATYTISGGGGSSKFTVAGAAVTASANDGNVPANAVDGNLGTRWAAQGNPQWIQVDLGSAKTITEVKHAWYNGNTRVYIFDVQVSANGSSFTTVVTGAQNTGTSLNLESLSLPGGTTGRYVRLVCHGSNVSTWNSLTELEVWGTAGGSPPPTVVLEAESISPVGSGATVTIESDPPAGNGQWVKLASTASGQYVQFTTTSLPAGTYQVQLRYTSTSRGTHTVTIDGTAIGGTVDEYAAGTSVYVTVTLGTRTFASAGTHTIRLTVNGKNASSTGYLLGADSFTFVGQ
jgi:hypothetical protein